MAHPKPKVHYSPQATLQTDRMPTVRTDLQVVAEHAKRGRLIYQQITLQDGETTYNGPLREQQFGTPPMNVRYVEVEDGIYVLEMLTSAGVPRRPVAESLIVKGPPSQVEIELIQHLRRLFDAWCLVGGPIPPELIAYLPIVLNSLEFWLEQLKGPQAPINIPAGGRDPEPSEEPEPAPSILTTPLASCFPPALVQAFSAHGWTTLGDLVSRRLDEVLKLKGINFASIQRIRQRLEQIGVPAPGLVLTKEQTEVAKPTRPPRKSAPAPAPGLLQDATPKAPALIRDGRQIPSQDLPSQHVAPTSPGTLNTGRQPIPIPGNVNGKRLPIPDSLKDAAQRAPVDTPAEVPETDPDEVLTEEDEQKLRDIDEQLERELAESDEQLERELAESDEQIERELAESDESEEAAAPETPVGESKAEQA